MKSEFLWMQAITFIAQNIFRQTVFKKISLPSSSFTFLNLMTFDRQLILALCCWRQWINSNWRVPIRLLYYFKLKQIPSENVVFLLLFFVCLCFVCLKIRILERIFCSPNPLILDAFQWGWKYFLSSSSVDRINAIKIRPDW